MGDFELLGEVGDTGKALTVPGAAAPTVGVFASADGFEGMEGMTPEDLGVGTPFLQLIHKIDRANDPGRPGWWRLGEQVFEAPTVVLIRPSRYRALTQGEGKDTRTVCGSEDMEKPHAGVTHPKDVECASCAYAQWDDDPATKKRKPPKCAEGQAWLGILPGSTSIPFIVRFKGWQALESIAQYATAAMATQVPPGEPRGYWRFKVKLTSLAIEGRGFTYYVPVLTAQLMPLAEAMPYQDVSRSSIGFKHRPNISNSQEPKAVEIQSNGGNIPGGGGTIPPSALNF